jgi:transcription antitermination factor NusG
VTEERDQKWFVARAGNGREVKVKHRLEELGIEHFIPTEMRKNYRGQDREHAVIPSLVFLRTTKPEACTLKTERGLPVNYLFDHATHTMLTVPDKQMDDFIRVFSVSITEGGLVDTPVQVGEKVRVSRGPLKGVEGNILELQGKLHVVVGLCACVFAYAKVPRAYLEKTS